MSLTDFVRCNTAFYLCVLAACSGTPAAETASGTEGSGTATAAPSTTTMPTTAGMSGAGSTATSPARPGMSASRPGAAGTGAATSSAAGSGTTSSTTAGQPAAAGAGATPSQTGTGDGFYHLERLDRGLVALSDGNGVFVSFRMLGYEYDAERPERVTYELLRDGTKLTDLTDSTSFRDASGTASSKYSVRAVIDGAPQAPSPDATVWPQPYLRIPIERPANGYSANDASAADLDGDGQYEIILKWDPDNAKDNSQAGVTGNVYLDALKLSGERLWRIDLGPNIRAGAHYTQFIVFDLDNDGNAELAVKTAPGTQSGDGELLSLGPAGDDDDGAVYRNGDGYVLTGPEYLTVFNGMTGAELATVDFDVPRGNVGAWGDDYGNRVDRLLATAAYLDDSGLPSFVMARGYYTRSTLTAWNFREGKLTQLWKFDSDDMGKDANGKPYAGQGTHSLSVANIDDDPQQEIIYGAMAIDHDGKGKCSTGYGHADALHVTDLVPSRPGLEVYMPNEDGKHPAYHVRDANSCEIVFDGPTTGDDTGRAVAADIFPDNPGAEIWASGGPGLLDAASGKQVGPMPSSTNFLIWWDGDESRELEDKTAVQKYGGQTLVSCGECTANNGTKATPTLVADILGDWREEVIWRETDNSALRIYTTTDTTKRRIYTLMHDAQYRVAISWQNVAYNQPPHPSFHIGNGMEAPPKPDMQTR
jgi:rhamnogalacturonan endolyase